MIVGSMHIETPSGPAAVQLEALSGDPWRFRDYLLLEIRGGGLPFAVAWAAFRGRLRKSPLHDLELTRALLDRLTDKTSPQCCVVSPYVNQVRALVDKGGEGVA